MEGSVGAGTGMISYGFKGGIGTASRRLPDANGGFTVGVLVNANHGRRAELMMGGVLVGQRYDAEKDPSSLLPNTRTERASSLLRQGTGGNAEGSIIVIIATDAPLDSRQLTRLGKRAALGLARTGLNRAPRERRLMLAFSTGNVIPHYPAETDLFTHPIWPTPISIPVITATVEATEEAILNALTGATTVVGRDGHRADAISIPHLRAHPVPRHEEHSHNTTQPLTGEAVGTLLLALHGYSPAHWFGHGRSMSDYHIGGGLRY